MEVKQELGADREMKLAAHWGVRRIILEKRIQLCIRDAQLPIFVYEDTVWNMQMLDRFISTLPNRAKMYGSEAVENAHVMITKITEGVQKVRDQYPPLSKA